VQQTPCESHQWTAAGNGGYYTAITQNPAPKQVTDRFGGVSHPVVLPSNWGEILGRWDEGRSFADNGVMMDGMGEINLSGYFVARLTGASPEEAKEYLEDPSYFPEALGQWNLGHLKTVEDVERVLPQLTRPQSRQVEEAPLSELDNLYRGL
jgi:hypothetical protein